MWRHAPILIVLLTVMGVSQVTLADLNPTTAQRAATRRLTRVRRCYRQTLDLRPQAFGAVRVSFRVTPEGRVTEQWISLTTTGDADLETCILEAFQGLRFPAFQEGQRVVSVSLLLVTEEVPEEVVEKQRAVLEKRR